MPNETTETKPDAVGVGTGELVRLLCEKCGWYGTANEVGGKQHRDGDVDQWCPKCGASDDHLKERASDEWESQSLAGAAGSAVCWRCEGRGEIDLLEMPPEQCRTCEGTGRVKMSEATIANIIGRTGRRGGWIK